MTASDEIQKILDEHKDDKKVFEQMVQLLKLQEERLRKVI